MEPGKLTGAADLVTVDPNWRAPAVPAELLAEVLAVHLPALERHLAPAPRAAVSARLATLLAHYFVPGRPQALDDAIAADWVNLLDGQYPAWAINQAAEDWLAHHERRPTIADIRRSCEFWTSDARADLQLLRRLEPVPAAAATAPAGAVH